MSEKTIAKIQREAKKLAAQGFPFHASLLVESIGNGTMAQTVERVCVMLERGKRFPDAKRLRDIMRAPNRDKVTT